VLEPGSQELTEGCACVLVAPDLCLNIDVPPGQFGQVQSTAECTSEAVAACETGGNVIEIACDPANDPACAPPAEDCDNGTDDDGDGDVDCDDADCANDPACAPPAEDCDNGTDDDGDGDVDCDDADCANDPACAPPAEDCDNGTDDDGDGDVDCDDADCAGAPNCQPQECSERGGPCDTKADCCAGLQCVDNSADEHQKICWHGKRP
jgi:hypothetical protein